MIRWIEIIMDNNVLQLAVTLTIHEITSIDVLMEITNR